MAVALREEDYTEAARIRDHPFMQLYVSIHEALLNKDFEVALRLNLSHVTCMHACTSIRPSARRCAAMVSRGDSLNDVVVYLLVRAAGRLVRKMSTLR